MQCYVCFQPCKDRCCNCKDRFLHSHCRATMIKHGHVKCPVCLRRLSRGDEWVWALLLAWVILSYIHAANNTDT